MSEARTITILYFAWVRERIGRGSESLSVPASIVTVADLVAWLRARGPEYELAFAKPDVIRAALDQTHVKSNAPLAEAREVAFFPPVTGG
jgi:molybdopterin synthase sulfur carrier subunit